MFSIQATNIQHLRDVFIQLNDSINECHLELNPKYESVFEILWVIDDMFH